MDIRINKIGLLIIPGVLAGMLVGCSGGGSGSSSSGSQTTVISVSSLGEDVTGLSATLEITGMDTYPMTVNTDDTVSATIEGISPGMRTFTVTYYADDVVLARASSITNVVAGQNVSISFASHEIDRNFDDDFDGWTNLAEILWGSEPLLATDTPPSEVPEFVLSASGGQTESASYTLQDTLGEGINSGGSTGLNYSLAGGFQAYH